MKVGSKNAAQIAKGTSTLYSSEITSAVETRMVAIGPPFNRGGFVFTGVVASRNLFASLAAARAIEGGEAT